MTAAVTLDPAELAKLSQALRAIAGATGSSAREVLHGFAGVVLKACAGQTKVATAAQTVKRSNLRFLRDQQLTGKNAGVDVTISAGVRKGSEFGRVFLRGPTGHWRRTHNANFVRVPGMPNSSRKKPGDHYADYQWLLLQSAISTVRSGIGAAREAGRKTIGLARQSWVQIADSLNIRLEDVRGGGTLGAAGIAKARAALASNGYTYINGLGREERSAQRTILTLINRYPRGQKMGMDATLRGVLIGQIRYFEKNLSLGVFNSIRNTARAYPFLKINALN